MKRLLIIFSYKYPFSPPVEQFLHMEMPYHSNENTDIWFVPYARDCSAEKTEKYDISYIKNVSIKQLIRKKKTSELVKGLFEVIRNLGNTILELSRIMHEESFRNKACLYSYCSSTIQSLGLYLEIKDTINLEELKGYSEIVLYSYWLNAMAAAICIYKQFLEKCGYSNISAIARAHGQGDLYLEPDTGRYRPNAKLLSKNLDRVYSISINGMKHLNRQGIANVSISRLGVKLHELSEKNIIGRSGKKLIVSCSVINSNKRVIDIAKAIAQLEMSVIWVHFGSGPEENQIHHWCEQNMPTNVDWKLNGWTPNKNILDFYLSYCPDVFVNLSYIEGIPVSIMEAMSCGIPCVATNTGASCEIVKSGENGYLVSKNFGTREVSDCLSKCLGEENIELKLCALKTAAEEYSSEVNFQKFSREIWKLREGELKR